MSVSVATAMSANPNVNGILSGGQWNAGNLTFSFPTSAAGYGAGYGNGETTNGFAALNNAQQDVIKTALYSFAAVAKLNFTQVSEGAGDLRFARSGAPATCWTYTPSAFAEAGDVWIGPRHVFDAPVRGGYAWLTLTHETGLSLGFKDAFETKQSATGVIFGALGPAHDSTEYTIESYASYLGADTSQGYVNGSWDYPQSLMLDDIAAIQYLYGARFDHAGANETYAWSPSTGELSINGVRQGAPGGDRIFQTVWTAGAHVTYDLSAYTSDLAVDLRPGRWSTFSTAQLAHLDALTTDTHRAAGNVANAYYSTDGAHDDLVADVRGGSGADSIIGNDADNTITGGAGDDTIDGGAGRDTAAYSGRAVDYAWSLDSAGVWTVRDLRPGAPDGRDVLKNVEVLQFADKVVALDAPAPAPAPAAFDAAAAYKAVLFTAPTEAPPPLTDAATREAWIKTLAQAAVGATSVATTVYAVFTGATPSQAGLGYLLDPSGPNANSLNSAGFQALSVEDRYINLSVALGGSSSGVGFQAAYSGLSLNDAYMKAYLTIYGSAAAPEAAKAALDATVQTPAGSETRAQHLADIGAGSEVATKAALVGWLISAAIQSDTGLLAQANDAYLHDLATNPHFAVNLVGESAAYLAPT